MKNKKIILIIAGLIVAFSTVYFISGFTKAKNNKTELNVKKEKMGPKISLETSEYDFGSVKLTDVVGHNFYAKNIGDEPLEILRLSTSCGCTSAEIVGGEKIIQPGEKANIRVKFDPSVHKDNPQLGEITRVVYVKTNDKNLPEAEINIFADVEK